MVRGAPSRGNGGASADIRMGPVYLSSVIDYAQNYQHRVRIYPPKFRGATGRPKGAPSLSQNWLSATQGPRQILSTHLILLPRCSTRASDQYRGPDSSRQLDRDDLEREVDQCVNVQRPQRDETRDAREIRVAVA